METGIPALVLGLVLSLALTVLMAASSLARTGLRGRRVNLFTGLVLGLFAGVVELIIAVQLLPLTGLIIAFDISLWWELALEAAVAAFSYFVVAGTVLQIGLFFHRKQARRSGDVVALAAGVGCGLALTGTLLRLVFIGVWPPSALFVAVVYPPVQLGFVLLLAAGLLATREGLAMRAFGWQMAALAVQLGYQFVFRANDTIGHWLAWLEPMQIGWLWLGLIVLAWGLGLAVMSGLNHAEPEPPYQAFDPENGFLRAKLWVWLAGLVLVPTGFTLGQSMTAGFDAETEWIMILALLATPLMTGAILLRTAFTLRRVPERELWAQRQGYLGSRDWR